MKIRNIFKLASLTIASLFFEAQAQDFDTWFHDETLRIDYLLSGNSQQQHISVKQLSRQACWAGRRQRLSEIALRGNGQLIVCDHASGDTLYCHTFSTLFQEWLLEPEAKQVSRSFEAAYQIPFPRQAVDISLSLTDNHGRPTTTLTHTVDPQDILIRKLKDPDYEVRSLTPWSDTLPLSQRIDLAIVAEGYTAEEMPKFWNDSQRAVEALFEREPFASLRERFHVLAVAAISADSGPSEPGKGIWKTTAAGTHFDTFYSERYLTTNQMHHLHDLLAGVPYEHIIVMANTARYGGGGIYNQVTITTSDHPTFKQVLVHEFGHAYGGLGDEYAYGTQDETPYPADIEPWEPNLTTLHDFQSKWADMLPEGTEIPTPLDPSIPHYRSVSVDDPQGMATLQRAVERVGVFEGAGYMTSGCYRPAQLCRMQVNEVLDFCPVCQRALRQITDYYTKPY